MEDPASRIAEWIECGGGLGQSEWVLWSATNKLDWEYTPDTKTLSIPMRRSRGGSPMEFPLLDPQVEKAVEDHFRLLEWPKGDLDPSSSSSETPRGKRHPRARTKTEKLPPGASLV